MVDSPFDLGNAATKGRSGSHAGDNWRDLTAGGDRPKEPTRYDDVGPLEADFKASARSVESLRVGLAPPAIDAMGAPSDGIAGRIVLPA
jgi:hypothetical protein